MKRAPLYRGASLAPTKWIIGIDEVGRGCLAGMVTVAALAMPASAKFKKQISKLQAENESLVLRDSKKLNRFQREEWFKYIKDNPTIFYATASIRPGVIDRVNIAQAANRAATKALLRLISQLEFPAGSRVFLDGGLYVKLGSDRTLRTTTVIRGDETIPAISLASIVAKVTRDNRMRHLHRKYPAYGFLRNVGYGTREHRRALKKLGPTPLHRLTFIKKYVTIR